MNKRIIFLSGLLFILICFLIHNSVIKYVYVNPNVNSNSLKPISKSIKYIDRNLNQVMKTCNKDFKDMKYVYKNYYGSGFLKENTIPNDLDASVGIDLGTYEYNGKNAFEIAQEIETKISNYHIFSYVIFSTTKQPKFISDASIFVVASELAQKRKNSIANIEDGIKKVLAGNVQVIYLKKKYKGEDVDYTFILNKNEVLVNDFPPLITFTKDIVYNKNMLNYPRELSIIPDFYVKIKDTRTNKISNIELVEESFLGERFQISRRFFVPIVFTGNESLNFLKNLDYLNDDKKFIDMRMFNYFRYIDEIELYFDYTVGPIKLLKRMHQCLDIIYPALTNDEINKIYSDIREVMQNKDIQYANEYLNALKNITSCVMNEDIFKKANESGYLADLIIVANSSYDKLLENKNYEKEMKELSAYHYQIMSMIKNLNSREKLGELASYMDDNYIIISVPVAKIINKNVNNKKEFVNDYNILKNVMLKAGFKKIQLFYTDKGIIYITEDDFTKKLSQEDLKKMVKQNNLPEAQYVFINQNNVKKMSRSELKWVRYNTTKEQDAYWQNLQQKLLEDKNTKFKIKRKYVL